MAHFYASIQGNRGEATRTGTKDIVGHVRGWDLGIMVTGWVDKDGNDSFGVSLTSGSNGNRSAREIGTFTIEHFESDRPFCHCHHTM